MPLVGVVCLAGMVAACGAEESRLATSEHYVWRNASWQLEYQDDYDYDAMGRTESMLRNPTSVSEDLVASRTTYHYEKTVGTLEREVVEERDQLDWLPRSQDHYSYDEMGRIERRTKMVFREGDWHEGLTSTFVYDDQGRIQIEETFRPENPNLYRYRVEHIYDAQGQISAKKYEEVIWNDIAHRGMENFMYEGDCLVSATRMASTDGGSWSPVERTIYGLGDDGSSVATYQIWESGDWSSYEEVRTMEHVSETDHRVEEVTYGFSNGELRPRLRSVKSFIAL